MKAGVFDYKTDLEQLAGAGGMPMKQPSGDINKTSNLNKECIWANQEIW